MRDERFTTRIARDLAPDRPEGDDAAAAAVLLQAYLDHRGAEAGP
jgi:RNase H-fold protein (predicted Holliday junction resolvase)